MPRAIAAIAIVLLAACAKQAAAPGSPPPATVDVVPAASAPVERVVRLLGQTSAVDGVMVGAKTTGIVAEIAFASGAEVQQGQILVRLDSAREEAALRESQGERDKAAKELENRQPLLARGLVSQDDIDRLAAELAAKEGKLAVARAALAERTIVAPFAGSIGIRRISVGSLLQPGSPIAPLARMDPLQVAFAVPEVHLASLRPGLVVRASTPAWPGRVFSGNITAFDPGADEATRAVGAVAVLPNPDRALKPGMALTVELVLQRLEEAVTVPEQAVVQQGGQAFVWTVVEGKAKRQDVSIGVRMAGSVQIAEGLEAGTPVVVQGLQFVRPGQPVQVRK
ncbi:MAG: efflux RND transporter periplasmic adaptor subunit [Planctomycetes bacterium]|nr:efflux RND transporter periplasmic adaptor subunit [Planctomycetota bacterium]